MDRFQQALPPALPKPDWASLIQVTQPRRRRFSPCDEPAIRASGADSETHPGVQSAADHRLLPAL